MKAPKYSPWGPVDQVRQLDVGILEIGTPSHGGLKLSPKLNKEMPAASRRKGGWYEEDVEWSLVALKFPGVFSPADVGHAIQTAKDWLPKEYEAITGEKVSVRESRKLQQEQAQRETRTKFVTRAAWGDWAEDVPKGMVKVLARKESTGVEAEFLVPKSEYVSQVPGFGFIVDEKRYKRVTPKQRKPKRKKSNPERRVKNVRDLVREALK
jgi:hypothetical protein